MVVIPVVIRIEVLLCGGGSGTSRGGSSSSNKSSTNTILCVACLLCHPSMTS